MVISRTGRHVRDNIAFLDGLLIEAIDYLDGGQAADLVRRARAASAPDRGAALEGLFDGLTPDEAVFLARAFACHSMLANVAEDVAGRRRHVEPDAGPGGGSAAGKTRLPTLPRTRLEILLLHERRDQRRA